MNQVVLGYPKNRSILGTFQLPVDAGSFSATHQVLSSMAALEVEQTFQLAIFEMGMFAAAEHLTAKEAQLHIDQKTDLSGVPLCSDCHTSTNSITQADIVTAM